MVDFHVPEKSVKISNLDKTWVTPQLKQLLRQVQRERIEHGRGGKFKKLWSKFRRLKRARIKNFNSEFVKEMKTTNPAKFLNLNKNTNFKYAAFVI